MNKLCTTKYYMRNAYYAYLNTCYSLLLKLPSLKATYFTPQVYFVSTMKNAVKTALRVHKSNMQTRFPTKYNPFRSAFKQKILMPKGVSYNPAPAAPTPLETPAAFLPPSERAKRVYLKDAEPYDIEKMPRLSPAPLRTYHLTPADAEEISRLRTSEPEKWTLPRLAEKYKVSTFVISMLSKPNPAYTAEMAKRLETIQSTWPEKRVQARKDRLRRKESWLNDS